MEFEVVETKQCTRCQVEKPLDQYYRSRTNRDGLYGTCKACHGDQTREGRAARRRALDRLAALHPEEFAVLLEEERQRG